MILHRYAWFVLPLLAFVCPRPGAVAQSPFSWQLSTDQTISTSSFVSVEAANGDLVIIHQSFIFPSPRMLHFKRFSASGALLTAVDYEVTGEPAGDNFHVEAVLELPNGDIALCATENRAYFLRLSAQGQILVATKYQSAFGGYSGLYDMRLLNSTTLVAHGLITPTNANGQSFFARLDFDGNILESWSDRFNNLRGLGRKLVLTQDQGMLMGGMNFMGNVSFDDRRAFVQKLNAAGQVVWARSITNLESALEDLVELPSGAVLALMDYYPNGSNYSPLLVKFSATGAVLHAQHVATDAAMLNNWQNYHIVPMNDGTFLISGDDLWGHVLARADTNGIIAPVVTLISHNGGGLLRRSQPLVLDNGDLLLTGWRSTGPGSEAVIARVPAGAPLPCDTTAMSLFSEEPVPEFDNTVVRSNPAVVTTDVSAFFLPAAWPWNPLALCLPTSTNDAPEHEEAIDIFPNPASDRFQLVVKVDRPQHADVSLTNALGSVCSTRRVEALPDQPLVVDTSELPAGAYVVELRIGTVRQRAMLLVQH